MPSNNYLPTTWYDHRVKVHPSSIQGMGMVARQPIREGEIVVRIGETIMMEEEFQVITGNDWQRRDVQERYRDHFSPFLNERIRRFSEGR
ncbi:hypothetical protein KDH_75240 [Dictyobacter sp. S3.2.2.5]|uniref:MOSC domain-containing protein n=1 Tax=Dictyobacter halimunensis TaxID=3026934 RepID=A0ABQ6G485_9CHLR|nr:hypothetical protein KDH_75240 [Dictyobacter sp. S3.2.2.5]